MIEPRDPNDPEAAASAELANKLFADELRDDVTRTTVNGILYGWPMAREMLLATLEARRIIREARR